MSKARRNGKANPNTEINQELVGFVYGARQANK